MQRVERRQKTRRKTAEDKALAAQKAKCKRYIKTIGMYAEPTLFLYLPYL
jgi:hypothetical protein